MIVTSAPFHGSKPNWTAVRRSRYHHLTSCSLLIHLRSDPIWPLCRRMRLFRNCLLCVGKRTPYTSEVEAGREHTLEASGAATMTAPQLITSSASQSTNALASQSQAFVSDTYHHEHSYQRDELDHIIEQSADKLLACGSLTEFLRQEKDPRGNFRHNVG